VTTRGYTLVEIVVVLAILAVVTGVVLPAMMRGAPDGEQRAAEDLARILRMARRAALEGGAPVSVTVVPATRAYVVETGAGDTSTVLARGVLALPPGVRLASDRPAARFAFDRLGTARPDSVAVIGERGSNLVTVDRWTGEIGVGIASR
jgi:prepilin-type N-terminal cleavage/methylation domain-containing protein